jgi:hypothetical protein
VEATRDREHTPSVCASSAERLLSALQFEDQANGSKETIIPPDHVRVTRFGELRTLKARLDDRAGGAGMVHLVAYVKGKLR